VPGITIPIMNRAAIQRKQSARWHTMADALWHARAQVLAES
jgi:hypothetical protein